MPMVSDWVSDVLSAAGTVSLGSITTLAWVIAGTVRPVSWVFNSAGGAVAGALASPWLPPLVPATTTTRSTDPAAIAGNQRLAVGDAGLRRAGARSVVAAW